VSLKGEAEMVKHGRLVEMFRMDKPVRGSEIEMLAILLSSLQPTPHLSLSADKYGISRFSDFKAGKLG
jgi:hypothetical protein